MFKYVWNKFPQIVPPKPGMYWVTLESTENDPDKRVVIEAAWDGGKNTNSTGGSLFAWNLSNVIAWCEKVADPQPFLN